MLDNARIELVILRTYIENFILLLLLDVKQAIIQPLCCLSFCRFDTAIEQRLDNLIQKVNKVLNKSSWQDFLTMSPI